MNIITSLIFISIVFCGIPAQGQNNHTAEVEHFRMDLLHSAMQYPENPPLTAQDTSHLKYFPIDTQWRIRAKFNSYAVDTFIKIPTTAGTEKVFKILGEAKFSINDTIEYLTVYQPFRQGLEPYIFIPFKDGTSGLSTYGGGRYLELGLNVLSEDQRSIDLDFNKAFNPWCAYRSGYFCPLPPEDNHLKVSILAGEKNFTRHEGN